MNKFDAPGIDAIAKLAAEASKNTVVHDHFEYTDPDGRVRRFSKVDGKEIPRRAQLLEPVFAAPLRMSTLQSLVSYVDANRDGLPLQKLVLQVTVEDASTDGSQRVELLGPPEGETKARPTYAIAIHHEPVQISEKWLQPHELIIALQTCFVRDENVERLLNLLARVSNDTSVAADDNGIVQSIVVRQNVALNAPVGEKLPSPIDLRLFRTFRELPQPLTLFTLRADTKPAPGTLPRFSLNAVQDGKWTLDVRDAIKTRLESLINSTNEVNLAAKLPMIGIPILV